MRKVLAALVLTVWACSAGAAHAGVAYAYVSDATNYNVDVGSTVTVNLYLQETLTGGSSSIVQLDGGLFGASVLASEASSNIAMVTAGSAASTTQFPGNSPNVQTHPTSTQIGDQTVGSQGAYANGASISTTVGSTTTNEYFLGTATIQGVAAGISSFTLSHIPPPGVSGRTTTFGTTNPQGGYYDLDFTNSVTPDDGQTADPGRQMNFLGTTDAAEQSAEQFTVTVAGAAAVPEPSGMLLSGLFVPVAGLGVWLRRRKVAIAAA